MIDSKGSVVECDQGSHDRLAGVPVVPDRGGQGKDALQDPHGYTGDGPATVLLKIQLALEGLVDRFDALPYSTKQAATGAWRFAAGRRSHHGGTAVVRTGFCCAGAG